MLLVDKNQANETLAASRQEPMKSHNLSPCKTRGTALSRFRAMAVFCLVCVPFSASFAQREGTPLRVFGYFQNSLQHWTAFTAHPEQNSFGLQQLNLFFQKDISENWTAFVNFEALNTFSSGRHWGAFNLEEAWVKYSADMRFNLKLGLQIPTFNNLNEIKNRTPLLPYIIRPLVYETSFGEFFPLEDFVPARAFAQAYGFFPAGQTKLDYAVYLGNAPDINRDPQRGQTGIDTTIAFTVGGRWGIRYRELKLGLSGTYEKTDQFVRLASVLRRPPSDLRGLPIVRFGGDLSFNLARFSYESEFILLDVNTGIPELELDLNFYYATVGYNFSNTLLGYASYWKTNGHNAFLVPGAETIEDENIYIATLGLAYDLNDRIRLKSQWARVRDQGTIQFVAQDAVITIQDKFTIVSAAVSVFF